MAFKFFTISIRDGHAAEDELNQFLRSHSVLSIEKKWVEQGPMSFWSFCIDYLDRDRGNGSASIRRRKHVDYREVLSDEDFAVFARLRELRKEIAAAQGIPVYTIFNNEQLAQMVQRHVASKAELESIVGVGDARVAKYGDSFLQRLTQLWGAKNEADGESI